jgi:uncharacterized membrane protein YphA (DoxX/SURF4 family)
MATLAADAPKPLKALNISLWAAQVLLGGMFAMAGLNKATQPVAALAQQIPWADDIPLALLRFIGTSELLGGIGLLLPALTRIRPGLTPLAAAGLTTIMALAAIFHATRGEWGGIVVNLVLGGIAAFIAWGRTKKVPIAPR